MPERYSRLEVGPVGQAARSIASGAAASIPEHEGLKNLQAAALVSYRWLQPRVCYPAPTSRCVCVQSAPYPNHMHMHMHVIQAGLKQQFNPEYRPYRAGPPGGVRTSDGRQS